MYSKLSLSTEPALLQAAKSVWQCRPATLVSAAWWQRYRWLCLSCAIVALLWIVAMSRAAAERTDSLQRSARQSVTLAAAYERYVTRSIAQIDQNSMLLKHAWEATQRAGLLGEFKRKGMFADGTFVDVCVVGADRSVQESLTRRACDSAARDDSFIYHQAQISSALQVSLVKSGERALILLSRRLDTPDDSFGGVIVLAVDADYFTQFLDVGAIGASGLVGLAVPGDGVEMVQRGGRTRFLAPHEQLLGQLHEHDTAYAVDDPDAAGSALLAAHQRGPYPLASYVAISRHEAMLQADMLANNARHYATLASIVVLLLGAGATSRAIRTTARQRERDELSAAYRTATESANEGFYLLMARRDRVGTIVDFELADCNERGAQFFGMQRSELVGVHLSTFDHAVFNDKLIATYRKAMETGYYEDERQMPADRRIKIAWGRRRIVRVGNALAVTLLDISESRQHHADMERMVNQDELTGLPNRHWLFKQIPEQLLAAQEAGQCAALLFVDLDEFKQINDTQGHQAGDAVLRAAAQRLGAQLRPSDRIARYGSDEFVILLAGLGSDEQVGVVCERIVQAFRAPFTVAGDIQIVGATVGVSRFPRDGNTAEALLKHSDIALHAAKLDCKGGFKFFDPTLAESLRFRAQLKNGLAEAVARGQLHLAYQPRVDTHSGQLLSMEALLRWQHPLLGPISPADFIALAEATGQIVAIGEHVIELACAQVRAWRDEGLASVPVSINVSPVQLLHGGVSRSLRAALARHQLDAGLIEVELTESAMIGDRQEILQEIRDIRALGIKLHVDDFGTGYSSLSQLQRFRMDGLKVDRAFTSELDRSAEGKVFFQAIVSMAHSLGMCVIAEGVETTAQLAVLRELGCDEVQGYLIARPLSARDMVLWMRPGFVADLA